MASFSQLGRRGFTLVELMMVVLIISVLAMLGVPAIARIRMRTKTTAILNDVRVFSAAFDTYAHETGGFPADSAAGVLPKAMRGRLDATAWMRVTPMGGKYNWEYNQTHFGTRIRAAISISAATGAPLTVDVAQLTELETAIDKDLNWLGGNFRLGTGLVPLFVIQE